MNSTTVLDPESLGSTYLTVVLSLLAALLAALAILIFHKTISKHKEAKLPPGPRAWGTSRQVMNAIRSQTFHELAWDWATTFGKLTFLKVYGKPILLINDASTARDLMATEQFELSTADKKAGFPGTYLVPESMFFTPYDDVYIKKRALLQKVMTSHGVGGACFESSFKEIMQEITAKWEKLQGESISADLDFRRSLTMTLMKLLLGQGQKIREEDLQAMYNFQDAFNAIMQPNVQTAFSVLPRLRKLPASKYKRIYDTFVQCRDQIEEILLHRTKATMERNPEDIDFGLVGTLLSESENDVPLPTIHMTGLLYSVVLGGFITMHTTLTSLFLVLLHRSDVVNAVQDEVDKKIGKKPIVNTDECKLHYTTAVVLENLRFWTQIPLNCFRQAREDIYFESHVIPKGTTIFLNNWFIHRDGGVWKDPWHFRPERFLNEQNELLPTDDSLRQQLLSWGLGLRSCPGQKMSVSRIVLIVAAVLQKFDVFPVKDKDDFPACDPLQALKDVARRPPPYCMRVVSRDACESVSES